jgi:hypothetical protein
LSRVLEQRFTAYGGKLVGQPDVVEGDAITDYKSGAIFDETEEGPSIKAGYARQLRLYGFLVHENLGTWPTRGILHPMLGEKAKIDLAPNTCIAEAEAAIALLDTVNSTLASVSSPSELASPSADACGRCPFRTICSAYWDSVTGNWAVNGRYGDAEVVTLADAEQVHLGAAYALHISVERGSITQGPNVISPLASSIHDCVERCTTGVRLRITGLCVRHNGQLAPTLYTVVTRYVDIPTLTIAPG